MELGHSKESDAQPVPLVAVVTNPKSSTMLRRIDKVRAWVERSFGVVHYELETIDDVHDAVEFFAHAKPAVIVINGGDGTVGAFIASLFYSGLMENPPPIAIVPGGKTNMTGADLGAKGRPEVMLEKILQLVRSPDFERHLSERNLIELDMQDGHLPYVGTFFGTAGIVRGIHWTRENAHKPGRPVWVSHIITLFTLLAAGLGLSRKNRDLLTSEHMDIYVKNGGRMSGKYASVLATTLDELVLGLRPYGKEGTGSLKFSAIQPGAGNLFRAVKGLITGAFGKKGITGVQVRRSDRIVIKGTDPVTLDGEIFFPTPGKDITMVGIRKLTFVSFKKKDIRIDED